MDKPFPIVGVGASAGGVEALEYLFKAMPSDPGMAFVVVTHLAPKRESLLPEILARDTRMPVLVAENDQLIRPNHVYVASADTVLDVKKGHLRIRAIADGRERTPIDSFFAGLAEDQGEYAIAIVLSGAGSDGTLGIKAIKEHGGLTLAQATDHSGPAHSGMPGSAIASGLVDLAVPVETMPEKLAAYARSFDILDKEPDKDEQTETTRRAICAILLDQGAGLCHRRRGLFARNHVARAGRAKPLTRENPDLRHRYRRSGALGGAQRPLSRYPAAGRIEAAARALLHFRRHQLRHQQADPRHVCVLVPQRGARSAVLAHGPDLLPQSAHLSQQ